MRNMLGTQAKSKEPSVDLKSQKSEKSEKKEAKAEWLQNIYDHIN